MAFLRSYTITGTIHKWWGRFLIVKWILRPLCSDVQDDKASRCTALTTRLSVFIIGKKGPGIYINWVHLMKISLTVHVGSKEPTPWKFYSWKIPWYPYIHVNRCMHVSARSVCLNISLNISEGVRRIFVYNADIISTAISNTRSSNFNKTLFTLLRKPCKQEAQIWLWHQSFLLASWFRVTTFT